MVEASFFLDAYLRRKRWEFEQQAVVLVNLFSRSMTGQPGTTSGTYISGHREIDTDAMLERIGS